MDRKKLSIGFISLYHLRDWGGITRLIDQIAIGLSALGHNITIIAQEGKASAKAPVSKRDYPHELITLDLSGAHGLRQARQKIASSGLDIFVSTYAIYMPWLLYGSGIPFVIAGSIDPRVHTFERWQPYEHYGALYSADAIHILLADYAVFFPEALRPRMTVIGNPAPPPAPVDFAARRSATTRTIIAVGRLNEDDKRLSYLLRTFTLLHTDFPPWRLKLVGDGPYWEYYRIMAEQLGIAKLVDFTGAVPDPDLHYSSADILCLPSIRAEGLPMVFLEASAHALPIVGYSSCVASSALITPDIGTLADAEHPDGVIAALSHALRTQMALSPKERECAGIRARDSFQEKYGARIVFDAWDKLLTDTINNTQRAGKTALEAISELSSNTITGIGPEWDGLGPNSTIWTPSLMAQAAAEIASREDPTSPPEQSGAPEEAESVRLRCELARQQADYTALEKKYAALMTQFQTVAGKKHGKR